MGNVFVMSDYQVKSVWDSCQRMTRDKRGIIIKGVVLLSLLPINTFEPLLQNTKP